MMSFPSNTVRFFSTVQTIFRSYRNWCTIFICKMKREKKTVTLTHCSETCSTIPWKNGRFTCKCLGRLSTELEAFFFIRFFSLSLFDFLSFFRLLRWYQNHISFSTYNPLIVVSPSTLLQLNVRLNGNQIDLFPYYKTHSHPIQYSRKWERNRNNNRKNEKFQFRSNCFLLLLPRPKRKTKNEKETDREWFRCWRSKTETRSHFCTLETDSSQWE